jgi:hypothetical protein
VLDQVKESVPADESTGALRYRCTGGQVMGTDFVVDRLTPVVLFIWCGGFVILIFVYY